MPTLTVIIGSTRPGRAGLPIAQWFVGRAIAHGAFEVRVVDLAELNLPFLDEPNHPRLRQYTHQHTKNLSAIVSASDAFVIVTPEYNYGLTAPVKNAIDFLNQEWMDKPIGFVSYGGVWAWNSSGAATQTGCHQAQDAAGVRIGQYPVSHSVHRRGGRRAS